MQITCFLLPTLKLLCNQSNCFLFNLDIFKFQKLRHGNVILIEMKLKELKIEMFKDCFLFKENKNKIMLGFICINKYKNESVEAKESLNAGIASLLKWILGRNSSVVNGGIWS